MELTRPTVLAASTLAAAAAVFPRPNVAKAALPITQPALPFKDDALAPAISARTVALHYGKHHKAYFDKLNQLAQGTRYADMELAAIVKASAGSREDAKIFNNAAQAWNHVAYWDQFKPGGPNRPEGELGTMIEDTFKGYDGFIEQTIAASDQVFGTGWVWLTRDDGNRLALVGYEDGNNPVAVGRPAYLGIDIWEHAYYLDYENRKPDHIRAVLDKLVNWRIVADRLAA